MIKMIIFDLDGTLVNTIGGIANACNYVLDKYGFGTKTVDEYMDMVGNGLAMTLFRALPNSKKKELLNQSSDSLIKESLKGLDDSRKQLDESEIKNHYDFKHLKGEPDFNIPELKQMIHELLDYYKLNPTVDSKLYEGINELLDFLDDKGIKWGIHTNKTASIAIDVANSFIDPKRYLGLKGPNDETPRKPDPRGSLDLIALAGEISMDEVVYIGDTEVDIETGKNLNVKVISVSYGFRKRDILESLNPDYIVDEPLELISLIKKLI